MANRNDESTARFGSIATGTYSGTTGLTYSGSTGGTYGGLVDPGETLTPIEINSKDNASEVFISVTDREDGAPVDFNQRVERYSALEDRWMLLTTDSQANNQSPVSTTIPAVPTRMRVEITNNSVNAAGFVVSVVTY